MQQLIIICPLSSGVSRETLDSSKQPLSTTLLYADKKSCLEAAEKVKTISSINVHQLTMRHEMSHELVLYLDREGLKSLWNVVFSHGDRSSGLHAGLLGVKMSSNFTVWLEVPAGLRMADRTGKSAWVQSHGKRCNELSSVLANWEGSKHTNQLSFLCLDHP